MRAQWCSDSRLGVRGGGGGTCKGVRILRMMAQWCSDSSLCSSLRVPSSRSSFSRSFPALSAALAGADPSSGACSASEVDYALLP